jgi:hypothetical protein
LRGAISRALLGKLFGLAGHERYLRDRVHVMIGLKDFFQHGRRPRSCGRHEQGPSSRIVGLHGGAVGQQKMKGIKMTGVR